MKKIQMVDLIGQYQRLKSEIDPAMQEVLDAAWYINGFAVKRFQESLEKYLDVKHVIPCANGTDALQIALMSLELKQGDEVIVPAFTYVATAEVIGLLGLKPILVDVHPDTYDINLEIIKDAVTDKTKVIVPVHLFGQSADMEALMIFAKTNNIYVVEDNAQAIGADYSFTDGRKQKCGTIADIGTTSFFPAKNLGCFGDGGAIFTNDDKLAEKLRIIANHGQTKQYIHDKIGVNSRLDALQAAVLDVKLKHLDDFASRRRLVADKYDMAFTSINGIQTPVRSDKSNHVFHQYTMRIKNGKRDELKAYLNEKGIPANIYYPIPLYEQNAFKSMSDVDFLPVTDMLCKEVLSLPIHTEMKEEVQDYIIEGLVGFYRN